MSHSYSTSFSYNSCRLPSACLILLVQYILLHVCVLGSSTFTAHRLLQYDRNRVPLGSRKSIVNHLASPLMGDHDLGRNIAIITIEHLTINLLQSLNVRRCQSLLIILPSLKQNIAYNFTNIFLNANAAETTQHKNGDGLQNYFEEFQFIEEYLLTHKFDFSVFFAFNDEAIINELIDNSDHLYAKYGTQLDTKSSGSRGNQNNKHKKNGKKNHKSSPSHNMNMNHMNNMNANNNAQQNQKSQLMSPFSMSNLYQLKGSETSNMIKNIEYTNIFGTLYSYDGESVIDTEKKYILIVANHDSYGVVPTLSMGANDNGSGVSAVMTLLILFQRLYAAQQQKNNDNNGEINGDKGRSAQPNFHLLFLLTAGGYNNYEGTKKWLEQSDGGKHLLKSIAFVFCVQSIAVGQTLYLQAPKSFDFELDSDADDASGIVDPDLGSNAKSNAAAHKTSSSKDKDKKSAGKRSGFMKKTGNDDDNDEEDEEDDDDDDEYEEDDEDEDEEEDEDDEDDEYEEEEDQLVLKDKSRSRHQQIPPKRAQSQSTTQQQSQNSNANKFLAHPKLIEKLYNIFESTALEMEIDFEILSQEIASDTMINSWHSQEFERMNILSSTLTARRYETKLQNGTSILDRRELLSIEILNRNIEYAYNVLYKIIFDMDLEIDESGDTDTDTDTDTNENVMINNNRRNHKYAFNIYGKKMINKYINYLSSVPRFGPYYYRSSYLNKLYSDMQRFTADAKSMKYKPESAFEKFYETDFITIDVFKVQPFSFDLIFLVLTLVYLFVFYIGLVLFFSKKGMPQTLSQFLDLFSSS